VIDRRRLTTYLALAFCLLLFSVSAVLSFGQTRAQRELAGSQANSVLFAVASFERELLKTLTMARPELAYAVNYFQETFRTQFEVFWSRINILNRGTESARIHSLRSFQSAADQTLSALARIESQLDAGIVSAEDVEAIRAELEALQGPVHALVVESYAELVVAADDTRAQLKESEWLLYGSFAGILLSAFALVLLLLRQIRTSQHLILSSRKALSKIGAQARVLKQEMAERNRAEEEVRRLNRDLERLVDERTAELRESQAQLLRNERLAALGQVAATVSHELRNPLGTIRASIVAVRDKTASSATQELTRTLNRIDRNVSRCDLIIDEMLDFSRSSALSIQTTNIDAWLGEVLTEFEGLRKVSLQRDLRAGVEAGIDRDRLHRALLNVLDNAVQALTDRDLPSPKQRRLEITVRSGVDGERLEIVVEDAGSGVPEAVLPKVFEPLVSAKSFGVGLGLPNARHILRQHGGDVELRSQEAEGTMVKLWFPIQAQPCSGERASSAA
jgi:signal transduction histidine kinase